MRKFIIALVFLLAIILVISRFAELQDIAMVLRQGDWRYVALALLLEIFWLFNLSFTFQAVYNALGLKSKKQHMIILSTTAYFVGTIAPSVGVTGLAIFLADGQRRDYPSGKVTAACMIVLVMEYVALLIVVSLGMIVLFRRKNLNWTEISAFIILFLIALSIILIIYLSMKSPKKLGKIFSWFARFINRVVKLFTKKPGLPVERAKSFAKDISDGIEALKDNPRGLLLPFVFAMLNKAILISIMYLIFLAFKIPYSIGTLVAGFGLANLFLIVSPTPSGVGFVEGILTLYLNSVGIFLEGATIVALGFRGITFWIPLIAGLFTFRNFSLKTKE
ncbi:MAG: flippase-like domain-containing protein [Anaerolineaceae bacterium]|nr:flippase-like domain-containing protein [Anaerolineaceae bacterium]